MLRPFLWMFAVLILLQNVVYAEALKVEATANEWLHQMVQAVQQLPYQGRSIFVNGTQLTSFEVHHAQIEGETWERIRHLSGEPSEVLRRGDRISCLHPEGSVDFSLTGLPGALGGGFKQTNFALPEYYMLAKGGSERVAGRATRTLDVMPKDRMRYGYRLWLDQETAMLLKSVTVDHKGKALEVFEFIDINMGEPLTKSAFEPGDGLVWLDQRAERGDKTPSDLSWNVSWLPKGFAMAKSGLRRIGAGAVSSKVFSDGLAAFTVFLEPLAEAQVDEGTQLQGATVAVSRKGTSGDQEFLVTFVGEVPMETALQVMASVKLD